jgi:hypothetical protein
MRRNFTDASRGLQYFQVGPVDLPLPQWAASCDDDRVGGGNP